LVLDFSLDSLLNISTVQFSISLAHTVILIGTHFISYSLNFHPGDLFLSSSIFHLRSIPPEKYFELKTNLVVSSLSISGWICSFILANSSSVLNIGTITTCRGANAGCNTNQLSSE